MTYSVKEIFYTLQGEGQNAGRPAVFCRFAGCNLWSGRERDRSRAACRFCDTDFVGTNGQRGGKFRTSEQLAKQIVGSWRLSEMGNRFVVFTGGEPLLQLDARTIAAVKKRGFEVAVETNGTIPCPPGVDWLCVSPKANTKLACRAGHELKLVFPQEQLDPKQFESLAFRRFYLQPKAGPDLESHTQMAVEYCLSNPIWRLSLQTHKFIGIP